MLHPESVQGQVGQGLEKPGLVEGVPAHGRDDLKVLSRPNYSMILRDPK